MILVFSVVVTLNLHDSVGYRRLHRTPVLLYSTILLLVPGGRSTCEKYREIYYFIFCCNYFTCRCIIAYDVIALLGNYNESNIFLTSLECY